MGRPHCPTPLIVCLPVNVYKTRCHRPLIWSNATWSRLPLKAVIIRSVSAKPPRCDYQREGPTPPFMILHCADSFIVVKSQTNSPLNLPHYVTLFTLALHVVRNVRKDACTTFMPLRSSRKSCGELPHCASKNTTLLANPTRTIQTFYPASVTTSEKPVHPAENWTSWSCNWPSRSWSIIPILNPNYPVLLCTARCGTGTRSHTESAEDAVSYGFAKQHSLPDHYGMRTAQLMSRELRCGTTLWRVETNGRWCLSLSLGTHKPVCVRNRCAQATKCLVER